jgi:transposase InsO family protein
MIGAKGVTQSVAPGRYSQLVAQLAEQVVKTVQRASPNAALTAAKRLEPRGKRGTNLDEAAMARYGVPKHLRSDNGPEFIAYAIQDWLKSKNVKTIYITPVRRGRTLTLRVSMTNYGTNV